MRWVFFCLLILNVVYLVWNLVSSAVPVRSAVQAPAMSEASLTLLREAGVDSRFSSLQSGEKSTLCVTLGPWSEPGPAQKQLAALAGQGYAGQAEPVEVSRDRLHWVYLPAYPSRDDALKVLRELQGRGVDSFIVSEGADANAISLGYFSSPESARGLTVKMQTAGYSAQTRETERVELEFWLYFPVDQLPDGGSALRKIIASNNTLSGKNVACVRR